MTKPLTAFAALLAALTLAACGEKEDSGTQTAGTESVDLVLDYFPNPDHAGIYLGLEDGTFRTAGLDVRPRTPSDPSAPLKLLQAGRADLAISYEPELLLARDNGAQLVAVGALVQKPLTSIISLGSADISSPADLEDKTVATAGIPYQDAYLRTILDRAAVGEDEVKTVNVGFNLTPALLSKRADAALGAFWNVEGVELERRDRNPRIIRVEDAGVPTYNELIIVARREDLTRKGPMIRRFMHSLARAHRSVREDPEAAADAVVEANPDLKPGITLASVRATLPVFFPSGRDKDRPFGYQSPSEWARYARWMYENELIRRPIDVGTALTNEFLPGEGL